MSWTEILVLPNGDLARKVFSFATLVLPEMVLTERKQHQPPVCSAFRQAGRLCLCQPPGGPRSSGGGWLLREVAWIQAPSGKLRAQGLHFRPTPKAVCFLTHLPVYPTIYLLIHPLTHPPTCLPTHLPACASTLLVHLPTQPYTYPPAHLPTHPPLCELTNLLVHPQCNHPFL